MYIFCEKREVFLHTCIYFGYFLEITYVLFLVQELKKTREEVNLIISALDNNISSEFIASNIREALNHLGSITGNITNDTLLKNIFSKFCIGK